MSRCLRGLDAVIGADAPAASAAVDVKQVSQILDKMQPMTVAQAHAAVKYGSAILDTVETLKRAYGGWFTPVQEKMKSDFVEFDKLVDLAHVDPLANATAQQIRTAVLQAVSDYNQTAATYKVVADVPGRVVDAGKDLVNSVAWYAKATYWVIIGTGVLAAVAISIGIASGVKHRISRT